VLVLAKLDKQLIGQTAFIDRLGTFVNCVGL